MSQDRKTERSNAKQLSNLITSKMIINTKEELVEILEMIKKNYTANDPSLFISYLLDDVEDIKPKEEIKEEIKEETIKTNTNPEIEKPYQKITIDDKIKKIETELKEEYSFKKEGRIKELKQQKQEIEKDKKNKKNGKVIETEEQKELFNKYHTLCKNRYKAKNKEDNDKIYNEIFEIKNKIDYPKLILVDDKEYTVYHYYPKHSYQSKRCILVGETSKFYKFQDIEYKLTHWDENQSSHYEYKYPKTLSKKSFSLSKDKFKLDRHITKYYEEDVFYTLCD